MSSRPRRGRRGSRPEAAPQLLHHLQALVALATRSESSQRAPEGPMSRAERRRQQHLALSRRLLNPLPPALRAPGGGADQFWIALRWGGCGVLLARWLGHCT